MDMTPPNTRWRVLVVEEKRLFAEVLRGALVAEGSFDGGTATTAEETLDFLRTRKVDLVLLDLNLGGRAGGLHLGRRILMSHADVKVMALSESVDPELPWLVLESGFPGYVTKGVPLADLVWAAKTVLRERVVIRLDPPARAVSPAAESEPPELRLRHLTARESEVLALLVEGASTEEVAASLGVANNTARTHIQSILTKLGVRSRLEAAAFAVRHGLLRAS